jgi:hypothetical protein
VKEISFDDVSALVAEGGLREVMTIACKQATADRLERRALVLRHPDLAQRLTQQPLNFTKPEHWNGAIPPETWREMPNDSPLRPALLELVAEAQQREARKAA